MEELNNKPEIGLDPENWEDMRALGHRMIDDMVDYLQHIGERPVWTPLPEKVKASFESSIPQQPTPVDEIYEEFKQNILPFHGGNIHPKYSSWVQGTGTAMGAFADLLAGAMNSGLSS